MTKLKPVHADRLVDQIRRATRQRQAPGVGTAVNKYMPYSIWRSMFHGLKVHEGVEGPLIESLGTAKLAKDSASLHALLESEAWSSPDPSSPESSFTGGSPLSRPRASWCARLNLVTNPLFPRRVRQSSSPMESAPPQNSTTPWVSVTMVAASPSPSTTSQPVMNRRTSQELMPSASCCRATQSPSKLLPWYFFLELVEASTEAESWAWLLALRCDRSRRLLGGNRLGGGPPGNLGGKAQARQR
mmetsp:Transcript_52001/g.145144  ORF Transcript_52001/g.145144 Transcript_52001/m.145144 type:complete len:244 (+) Transcript_52001:389-1120(+)